MTMAANNALLEKHLGNIAKLGKAELDDKAKAAFVKDAALILKRAKEYEKIQADLNKRIKDAKTLVRDIESYIKEFGAFIKSATDVSKTQPKINPDTKNRDFYMAATALSSVGAVSTLDDYP